MFLVETRVRAAMTFRVALDTEHMEVHMWYHIFQYERNTVGAGTELADLDVEFRPIMVVKHLSHSGADIQQFIKWVLRS